MMRRVLLTTQFVCLTASSILAGCSTDLAQIILENEQSQAPPTQASTSQGKNQTTANSPVDAPSINTQAQKHAQRLMDALAMSLEDPQNQSSLPPVPPVPQTAQAPNPHLTSKAPPTPKTTTIRWLDLPPAPVAKKQPTVVDPPPTPQAQKTTATPSTMATISAHEDDLVQRLITRIRTGNQSPFVKAMTLSTLGLAASGQPLKAEDLTGLDPQQAGHIRRLHAWVLAAMMAEKPNADQQSAMSDQLDQLFGAQAVSIGQIRLCRTVSGYGVYEPFESTTFLAGREQPVILYVELNQFRTIADGNQYRVRLTQEVDLFTEADGVRVWHLPREQIEDTSRNRRRDFFTVQLVRLPARLGVGQFRLKVRISDRNSSSFDETTIPITIVANMATTAKATSPR